MTRHRALSLLVVPVLVVAIGVGVLVERNQPWSEGSRHGPWLTVFTGYGRVQGGDDELELAPRPATTAERTHAALVVGVTTHEDLALSADVRTDSQLRRGDPNAWEVGWVLWHYSSPSRFYALALKPNGWELSKQDPAAPGGQRFLDSGTTPAFPVRNEYRVSVVQVGPLIKVSADGRLLTAFTDSQQPYLDGQVGFYTEDAKVTFRNIHVTDVNPSSMEGTHS
jgi:hypothetical protein